MGDGENNAGAPSSAGGDWRHRDAMRLARWVFLEREGTKEIFHFHSFFCGVISPPHVQQLWTSQIPHPGCHGELDKTAKGRRKPVA